MSDNWFVQHPQVMEYVIEHEEANRQTERIMEQETWDELQAVPSYVETQAAAWATLLALPIAIEMQPYTVHTWLRPFCRDMDCPCHDDEQLINQYRVQPLLDGVQTFVEGWLLFRGRIA
jgi:hypothetical protein